LTRSTAKTAPYFFLKSRICRSTTRGCIQYTIVKKQVESICFQSNNAINEQIAQHSQLPQVSQVGTWAYMSNQQFAPKAMELTPESVIGNKGANNMRQLRCNTQA
jgi:hypothetical protein